MDLAFTPEEEAFRQEVRAWVHANLPKELSHKVHNALRLTREDMQQWARILGRKIGWATVGPRNLVGLVGLPCKSIYSKKNALWRARRVSCLLAL